MRLRLAILSPNITIILGIILGITLYIAYVIYYTPIMLCDDNIFTLYQLKTKLISEIAKYKMSDINYEQYTDLKRELANISTPRFRDTNLENYYAEEIKTSIREHNESLQKINKLERSIKKLEPGFKLSLRSK